MQYGYNMAKCITSTVDSNIHLSKLITAYIKPPLALVIARAALRIDAVHLFSGRVGFKNCAN